MLPFASWHATFPLSQVCEPFLHHLGLVTPFQDVLQPRDAQGTASSVSSLDGRIPASSWLPGRMRGWVGVYVMIGSLVECRMPDIITPPIIMEDLKGRMAIPLPPQTLPLWFCGEGSVSLLEKLPRRIYCAQAWKSLPRFDQYCKVNCSKQGQPSLSLRQSGCPRRREDYRKKEKEKRCLFPFLRPWSVTKSEGKLIGLTWVSSIEGTLCSPSSQTSPGSVRIALEKPIAQAFS